MKNLGEESTKLNAHRVVVVEEQKPKSIRENGSERI